MSRYDLVVLGDCNPDVLVTGDDVTPSFGQQEKLVDGISLVIGGSAAITAVAAARLGLRVALAAAVGSQERHATENPVSSNAPRTRFGTGRRWRPGISSPLDTTRLTHLYASSPDAFGPS